jgi:hypothetical protein
MVDTSRAAPPVRSRMPAVSMQITGAPAACASITGSDTVS